MANRDSIVRVRFTPEELARIALGLNTNLIDTVNTNSGYRIQVYCTSQNTAVLMVSMVTTDFRTSGSREITLGHCLENFRKTRIQLLFYLGV